MAAERRTIQGAETAGDARHAELVRRASAGHADAFRGIHDAFHDRLYRYAVIRLGDREEARDAVQDVFVVAWRRLPEFEYRHDGSLPAWLFRIAANVVADRARRAHGRRILPLEAVAEPVPGFEGQVLARRDLVQALRAVPEPQREVLILRFVVDLSLAEVAAAIGRSEGAVTQLQLRGLRRIRKELSER